MIKHHLLLGLIYSLCCIWTGIVLAFIYPLLPDYWKLLGAGGMIFVVMFPLLGFMAKIDNSIYEDRIDELIKAGWRKVTMSDYATYSEYSNDSGYMKLFHSKHGNLNILEAEKLEKNKMRTNNGK